MVSPTVEDILIRGSRYSFPVYSNYVQEDLVMKPVHEVYYKILDMFAHRKIDKLIVTMPPQHGKSEGSTRKLPSYMLGINPDLRITISSYSDTFVKDFNLDVQKIMSTPRYWKVFPGVRMGGRGRSSVYTRNSKVFSILNRKGSLRAVSRGGALTGKPVDVLILDDLYKDYGEANSPVIRRGVMKWYTTVARKRLHNNSQQLIVFTRWHEEDLIGILEKSETVITVTKWADFDNIPKGAWVKINFEAIKTGEPTELDPRQAGEPLWPEMHSLEKLEAERKLDPVQFECLNQGNPGSQEGRLYKPFKTWVEKSDWGTYVRSGNYTDVADEGNDYLFSVCYDIYKSDNTVFNEKTKKFEPLLFALITDMEYTKESTEVTTITVPAMINRNGTQKSWIESNSGGAGFEKSVKKKVKSMTEAFYQSGNKESRVITNSAPVNQHIIFPFGWETRYKQVYDHVTAFLRDFDANDNDDTADVLTGVYEKEIMPGNIMPYNRMVQGIRVR